MPEFVSSLPLVSIDGTMRRRLKDTSDLLVDNSIWMGRTVGVGYLDLAGCMSLGITGPILRSTGLPHDLRKSQPYCGYENYEFDVVTKDTCDVYGRFLIRIEEMEQSLRIVEQCLDRIKPGPVMIEDKKIAWPAQLSIGSDGQGNSPEHIKRIMSESMEGLIHHFKFFMSGFDVPAGEVGRVDGYDLVGLSDFAPLARDGVQVLQRDPYALSYLGIHTSSKWLDSLEVRGAVMSAIAWP